MQTISLMKNARVSVILLGMASTAYGAQPPNVEASDANGNTAMGAAALENLDSRTRKHCRRDRCTTGQHQWQRKHGFRQWGTAAKHNCGQQHRLWILRADV